MHEIGETWRRQAFPAALAAGLLLGMAGCVEPAGERSLENPDSLVKILVLKDVAREARPDAKTLAQVIEELNNRDPAVRFYAIAALQSVTGQTFDYRYFDEEPDRQPAVEKWREWLADQRNSGPGHGVAGQSQ